MATISQYAPGTFCWPELATTDQEGARKFYTALMGWESSDTPIGEGQIYTTLKLAGRDVGALYSMGPDERKMAPPHWNSYVSVENTDAAVTKAKGLGATVIVEPMDVMEHGRMAVLQDPTGAVFCVWQAKKTIGASVLDETGALCWTELWTTDAAKATAFYTALFGWKTEAMPMSTGGTYTMLKRGDAQAGGLAQISPEMGPMPSHWMVYFAVADVDAAVKKATGAGAKITVPAMDIPNIGRFAILQDPQGAHFAVFKGQAR